MAGKTLNLALQGGGSHGAYSWGVLDRLLEESDITIAALSGTSAGAMNAAVLVDGFVRNGVDGAKESLHHFWHNMSQLALFSPLQSNMTERVYDPWNLDHTLGYQFFDHLSRFFSPYELNPLNLNPLRDVLEESLDVGRMQSCSTMRLFVTATNVHTGQPRVFSCDEVSVDALLASACLPFMFQAVTIDGEDYWDGGYTGNPAIWPLIYHSTCKDVLLVQINPVRQRETPKNATEIINRMQEISFNSSLIAEMRAIHFVSKLVHEGSLKDPHYREMRMHMMARPEEMMALNTSSKLNATWAFFQYLHGLGREACEVWLAVHKPDIGVKSSLDIEKTFLGKEL